MKPGSIPHCWGLKILKLAVTLAAVAGLLLSCTHPEDPGLPPVRYPRGFVYGVATNAEGKPIDSLRVDAEVFGRSDLVSDCEASVFSGQVWATDKTDLSGRYDLMVEWAPISGPTLVCLGVRARPSPDSPYDESTATGILLTMTREPPHDSVRVDLVVPPKGT